MPSSQEWVNKGNERIQMLQGFEVNEHLIPAGN